MPRLRFILLILATLGFAESRADVRDEIRKVEAQIDQVMVDFEQGKNLHITKWKYRRLVKKMNSLVWKAGGYPVLEIEPSYLLTFSSRYKRGPQERWVRDRSLLKLEFRDGLIFQGGVPFDTRGAGRWLLAQKWSEEKNRIVKESRFVNHQRATFVMDWRGEFYAANVTALKYLHHSGIAGGHPMAGVGEIVVHDGRLVEITDESGHYRPTAAMILRVIYRLRELKVHVPRPAVDTYDPRVEELLDSPQFSLRNLLCAEFLSRVGLQ